MLFTVLLGGSRPDKGLKLYMISRVECLRAVWLGIGVRLEGSSLMVRCLEQHWSESGVKNYAQQTASRPSARTVRRQQQVAESPRRPTSYRKQSRKVGQTQKTAALMHLMPPSHNVQVVARGRPTSSSPPHLPSHLKISHMCHIHVPTNPGPVKFPISAKNHQARIPRTDQRASSEPTLARLLGHGPGLGWKDGQVVARRRIFQAQYSACVVNVVRRTATIGGPVVRLLSSSDSAAGRTIFVTLLYSTHAAGYM